MKRLWKVNSKIMGADLPDAMGANAPGKKFTQKN